MVKLSFGLPKVQIELFRQFFDKRTPRQDSFGLGLRNIYIFFSRQGWLFLLLLLVTFVTGTNYGNNLVLGLFFYLLSIWLASSILTFLQLSGLTISLHDISLSQARGLMWVSFKVSTHSKNARQVQFVFEDIADTSVLGAYDAKVYKENRLAVVACVDGQMLVKLPIIAPKRGQVVLPRLKIISTYPLGIMQAWGYGYFKSVGFAYPSPLPMAWEQSQYAIGAEELNSTQYRTGQDDFDRLDSYVQGESLSRVSWTHMARGIMLTKHFGDPVGSQWRLDYADMSASHHEDKLSQLAYLVLQMKDSEQPFVLALPHSVTPMGVGDVFINECLLRLAKTP